MGEPTADRAVAITGDRDVAGSWHADDPDPEPSVRSPYAVLPERIPLSATLTGQEVDPFDPHAGRDPETDYLIRTLIPWGLGA